jgi:DNA-binding winged helix-turn-helix (wHTH) protein/tetratricopeptide (TPR) repeat protein
MKANITYKFDVFNLTVSPLKLYENGQLLPLTPKSLKILLLLIKNEGQPVSKEDILKEVWQDSYVSESVLAVNINTLRKTLSKDLIKNIKRRGYIFAGKAKASFGEEIDEDKDKQLEIGNIPLSFEAFIGREKELRLLQLNFQSVSSNKGMAAFIGGEAGIGKTNLIRRFLESIPQTVDSIVLTMSFFDFIGRNNECVFLYFKTIQQAFIQLNWLDAQSEFSEQIIAKIIKEKLQIEIPESLLGNYSNSSADDNKINQLSYKFSECLTALGKKVKTVIYFDDIQWSDELSLNLVGRLIRATLNTPLTILISARIDEETLKISYFNQWLQNHTKQNSFAKIDLKPFSLAECDEFTGKIFGGRKKLKSFTDADLFEVYQITNGSPFFLREYLYWLIADEKITRLNKSSDWFFNGVTKSSLPASITSFANSRINLLDEKDRTILEAACVTGEEFQVKSVAKVLNLDVSEIEKSLEVAVEKEILTKQILNRGNDFRFRHNLLYRTLYESILPNNLFYLHEQNALLLEESQKNDTKKISNSLAEHYEAAQNYQKCLQWSIEAAKYAKDIEDWRGIRKNIERSEKAIREIGDNDSIPIEIRQAIYFLKAYFLLKTDQQNQSLLSFCEKSIDLSKELSDKTMLVDCLHNYLHALRLSGRMTEFRETLDEIEQVSSKIGYQKGIWYAKKELTSYYLSSGKYALATAEAENTLQIIDDPYLYNRTSQLLFQAYLFSGRYDIAKETILKTYNSYKELGMIFDCHEIESSALILYQILTGNYETGMRLIESAKSFSENTKIKKTLLNGDVYKVVIRTYQGVLSEAKEIADKIHDTVFNSSILFLNSYLARIMALNYLQEKNFLEAKKYVEKHKEINDQVDDLDLNAKSELLFARYKNAIEKSNEANTHAKAALDFATQAGSSLNQGLAIIELAMSTKTYDPLQSIATAKKAVQILDGIKSGERWRAYWAVAQIQLSASNKLVKTVEIIENLTKTIYFFDEIRNQFDLNDIQNVRRYEESTKNHSEPAKELARLYLKLGDKENSQKIAESWNFQL